MEGKGSHFQRALQSLSVLLRAWCLNHKMPSYFYVLLWLHITGRHENGIHNVRIVYQSTLRVIVLKTVCPSIYVGSNWGRGATRIRTTVALVSPFSPPCDVFPPSPNPWEGLAIGTFCYENIWPSVYLVAMYFLGLLNFLSYSVWSTGCILGVGLVLSLMSCSSQIDAQLHVSASLCKLCKYLGDSEDQSRTFQEVKMAFLTLLLHLLLIHSSFNVNFDFLESFVNRSILWKKVPRAHCSFILCVFLFFCFTQILAYSVACTCVSAFSARIVEAAKAEEVMNQLQKLVEANQQVVMMLFIYSTVV